MSSLYILGIWHFMGHIICISPPPFSWLSFCLVDGFLQCANVFTFNMLIFVILLFLFPLLGCFCFPCWTYVKSIVPIFSSRSFVASSLIFRSLMYFIFILYLVLENVLMLFFDMQLYLMSYFTSSYLSLNCLLQLYFISYFFFF